MVPSAAKPLEGAVEVSVDCSSALFLGCHNRRETREEINAELTDGMQRLLADFPLQSLSIMPARFAWRIFIDVQVFQNDGSLLDAVSFAAWAALQRTKLPRLNPIEAQAGFKDDFALDSSPESSKVLDVGLIPVNVTLLLVGPSFVLDATRHEESCSDCRLAVAVNSVGQFCGMRQTGNTPIPPDILPDLFQCAVTSSASIFVGLKEAMMKQNECLQSCGEKSLLEYPDIPHTGAGFFS